MADDGADGSDGKPYKKVIEFKPRETSAGSPSSSRFNPREYLSGVRARGGKALREIKEGFSDPKVVAFAGAIAAMGAFTGGRILGDFEGTEASNNAARAYFEQDRQNRQKEPYAPVLTLAMNGSYSELEQFLKVLSNLNESYPRLFPQTAVVSDINKPTSWFLRGELTEITPLDAAVSSDVDPLKKAKLLVVLGAHPTEKTFKMIEERLNAPAISAAGKQELRKLKATLLNTLETGRVR